MDGRFSPGEVIRCKGAPIKIVKWLAEGGQGDVYVVEQNGRNKALKWYKPQGMGKNPSAFYQNLLSNYSKGAPAKGVFLWPEDVTEQKDGRFGYVMPLRPEGYYEITDYLLTKVRFASMKTVVDASLNIINAYRILHNNGYCYQDLNDGNFFINPETGEVLICDNDNVAPEGTHTGVVGKPGYIAPELIIGANAENPALSRMPDSYSDRFSMSTIIFMIFCLNRPLEGARCVKYPRTDSFISKVYGVDARFIMDNPADPEYGPDRSAHKNVLFFWRVLPSYMKEFFLRAFSQQALKNPTRRPTEAEWLDVLVRFRSEIIECQCGVTLLTENGRPATCGKCGRRIAIPYRISFEKRNYCLPGKPDSRIYRCQVGTCNADEALTPVGRVLAHNGNMNELGIRNLTAKYWNAMTPSGKAKKAMPQEIVPLFDGIRLYIEDEVVTIIKN